MTGCPNSTESGCRCVQHDPGLSVHAKDLAAYARVLAALPVPRIQVVAMPPTAKPSCDGTMTCGCQECLAERASRVAKGTLQGDRQQPWHVRPARRAA